MDIKSTTNTCDSKCSFNFRYPETTIQGAIMRNILYLKFGIPSIKPVKFNDVEYTPVIANLIYPSRTTYNGVQADAEFFITHEAAVQKPLIVRIPVIFSSISRPDTLDAIVTQIATLLPKTSYVNLTIPSFTLEAYVPKGPFHYTEMPQSHDIYYGLQDALSMSNDIATKLQQIIEPYKMDALATIPDLYYNAIGSNVASEGGADFNYLECDEVYEEEVPVGNNNNEPPIFEKMWRDPTIKLVGGYTLALFIAAVVLVAFYRVLRSL